MKKLLLFVLLFFAFPVVSMSYLKNLFYTPLATTFVTEQVQPLVSTLKPCIATIAINNDINFVQVMNELQDVANNNQVHGILLLIDNSGGSVGHFSTLHDTIKKIATIKPVVGLIVGYAFSGGYMIASACDYLICPSCTEIGSIGALWEVTKYKAPKVSGNLKAELDVEVIQCGEYKALTNPYKKNSEEQRAYMQAHTEKLYKQFTKIVAGNRNIDINDTDKWADAKIFISDEALELGLVDEIGTVFEAEDKLRALISACNPDVIFEKEINYLNKSTVTTQPLPQ